MIKAAAQHFSVLAENKYAAEASEDTSETSESVLLPAEFRSVDTVTVTESALPIIVIYVVGEDCSCAKTVPCKCRSRLFPTICSYRLFLLWPRLKSRTYGLKSSCFQGSFSLRKLIYQDLLHLMGLFLGFKVSFRVMSA